MSSQWTKAQNQVIQSRNENLLVSAAAGSGKTAVLVERIIQRILDEENPVDVDRLLVVTFTNAAAGEMKDRIRKALEEKAREFPENEHLKRQISFVHNAQITTIHSFCLNVIRNYFHQIDLDPAFRMADEGETKLLKTEVVKQVLESNFQEGEEKFYRFIESYAPGKRDEEIEDMILKIYELSQSYPWPDEWLDKSVENYNIEEKWEEKCEWYRFLKSVIALKMETAKEDLQEAFRLTELPGGPYMYKELIVDELHHMEQWETKETYEEQYDFLHRIEFGSLSRKRDSAVDAQLRERAKLYRNRAKDGVNKVKENFYFMTQKMLVQDSKSCLMLLQVFIGLVKEFEQNYQNAKKENGILDFHDLEHFALKILVEKTEGKIKPSQTALELSQLYQEVMIDEYQDSNLVQETILACVSGGEGHQYNRFMVGDVKQSIYKFRMARPEIFMEKLSWYKMNESKNSQAVILDKNFRSRKEVLEFTNAVFSQIMRPELGGILYDKENALYCGAVFPVQENVQDYQTEILLAQKQEDGLEKVEMQTRIIGEKIRKMQDAANPFVMWDREAGTYRSAEYRDFVILLRSPSKWQDEMAAILSAMGIPAVCQSQSGYFDSIEVELILNLLRVIDNPRQDVPLAGVLLSPLGGFDEGELAIWKIHASKVNLYSAMVAYAKSAKDTKLREKTKRFFNKLEEYRRKAVYLSIYDLLHFLYEETGIYSMIAASQGGDVKCENLDMLKQKAIAYEETVYQGLFHFVQYIEKLQKFDIDFGQASGSLEGENAVHIMSIHKSKGLEFPIVFIAGLEKQFNQQDTKSKLVADMDMGIGTDCMDIKRRKRKPTLLKRAICEKIRLDNLGEELRVLYVALTRAKEKLILVASDIDREKCEEKWNIGDSREQEPLPFHVLSSASSFLDWIGSAVSSLGEERCLCHLEYITMEQVVMEEVKSQVKKEEIRKELLHWPEEYIFDEQIHKQLEEVLEYHYPYETRQHIPTKVSVSELKKKSHEDEWEDEIVAKEQEPIIPAFLQEKKEYSGARRGTAYHRVFELFDFEGIHSIESCREMLRKLLEKELISEKDAQVVKEEDLLIFAKTSLYSRMRRAFRQGLLYREQPFVLEIDANQVDEKYGQEETMLVQGIIDVFFEEEGELVLADYKTDNVGQVRELEERYKVQLDYYQKALEQITGKHVKERIIYSVKFGEEILV